MRRRLGEGERLLTRFSPLTDAHDHEGRHSVQDAQVLDPEDNVVKEEGHQATDADAGNAEKGQEDWRRRKEEVLFLLLAFSLSIP